MASDTPPIPSTQTTAPAPPPPAATREATDPTKGAMAAAAVRDSLKAGIASRHKAQTAQTPAPLDTDGAKPQNTDSTPSAPKAQAPAKAEPAPASKTEAPAAKAAAPADANAAPPAATDDAPPAPATDEPAPASAQDGQEKSPPAKEKGLPAEYASRAWQDRFAADPLLKRAVARIEGDPNIATGEKALKIADQVRRSDERVFAQLSEQAEGDALLREDPYRYREWKDAKDQDARNQTALATHASRLIASVLDADENDPDYLNAGPREGESYEQGLERFKDFILAKSPLVRAAVAAELATLKADHEQAITQLNKDWQTKVDAARAEGRTEGRGTNPAPPRNGLGLPADAEARPPDFSPAAVRADLRAGWRLRQEAVS